MSYPDVDQRVPAGCQASCEAPTADGVYLCKAHLEELVMALRGVPGLVEDLEVTITRQSRTGGQQHGSRSADRPLVWNEHASTALTELTASLAAWSYEASCVEQDERDLLDFVYDQDTPELARWLARNYRNARRLDTAGDLHAEILDRITVATRAVDLPPEKKFLGICNTTRDDDSGGGNTPCREDLYALPKQRWVTCKGCGENHDADQRRETLLADLEDQLIHAGLLASVIAGFGVPVVSDTIRSWAHRGRLPVKGRDQHRRPLYRVGDVLDLALRRAEAA